MEKYLVPDKSYTEEDYQKLMKSVCLELNRAMNANKAVNSFLSGSTGIIVLLHGNSIICANVGDSRAGIVIVPAFTNSKKSIEYSSDRTDFLNVSEIELKMMSTDHTPDLEHERRRIIQAGGVVMPCRDAMGNFIGPPRIWDKSEESPGLMMSRSFGDQLGHRLGMVAEPETRVFTKLIHDRIVILGSDGLWEKLPQASILSVCSKYMQGSNPAEKICKELVSQAAKKWDKVVFW
jgi:serine/threonine protein phosphatase PrpC